MNLQEARDNYSHLMTDVTLALLIKDKQLLLARKKQKVGAGLWNGPGGKVDPGETHAQAMIREAEEELGVSPTEYELAAITEFYNEGKPEWTLRCYTYLVTKWNGTPTPISEMLTPTWFDWDKLPWDEMWPDDPFWLPPVLDGKKVRATFLISADRKMLEQDIRYEERSLS